MSSLLRSTAVVPSLTAAGVSQLLDGGRGLGLMVKYSPKLQWIGARLNRPENLGILIEIT